MNPAEILKDINAANLTPEQEKVLAETLGAEDCSLVVHIIRPSWVLSYEVPDEYQKGRCIQGHMNTLDGPEVEVMFPHSRDAEVQKLSRGERLELNVRYNHFDRLYSRGCFLDIGSNLSPAIEDLSEDPDPVHYYLANLLTIVYADSHLCPSEQKEMDKVAKRLNATKQDLDIAYHLISGGEYACKVVGSYAQQVQNLEDMMRVCLADGELHEHEQQWITHFSGMIGIDQNCMDKIFGSLDQEF